MDDFTFLKGNREMNIKQTCPKCGSTRTEAHEEDGYVVCFDCGYWTGESASWEQAVAIWNSQPLLDRALKAEREMESAYRDASRLTTRLLEQESKTRAVMRERDGALAKLEDAKIANTVHIADADLYREAEVAKHEAKIAIEERDAALAEVANMAAGAWRDGPAPKDGSHILALFRGDPYVVYWDSWQTGETIPGEGTYIDGEESGWIIARNGDALIDDEPEKWARIIHPNRHTPADQDTDWKARYEELDRRHDETLAEIRNMYDFHERKVAELEAKIAAMLPVVEAAVAWLSDLTEYAELELERTARDYRDKEADNADNT